MGRTKALVSRAAEGAAAVTSTKSNTSLGARVASRMKGVVLTKEEAHNAVIPRLEKRPMVGMFYRSTYIKICIATIAVFGSMAAYTHLNVIFNHVPKCLRVDDKPMKLLGLKRLRRYYKYAFSAEHIKTLRESGVWLNVAPLLLDNDEEIRAQALGTLLLIMNDTEVCNSAARQDSFLVLLRAFFDTETTGLRDVAKDRLHELLMDTEGNQALDAFRQSAVGRDLLDQLAFGCEAVHEVVPPVQSSLLGASNVSSAT